jgi:transcription antitermination factor NusG
LAEITSPWTVAYCKPRQEKALAWDLCRKEITYFLPMVYRETSSGGRRRRNLYPLFPSYLFFVDGEAERLSVLKTERVVRLIEVSEPEQPQFRREISSLDTVIRECPASLELYPRLVPGARVRIKSGPLRNVEGVVLQADNKKKLWLGISALGVGATVEIHADLVDLN